MDEKISFNDTPDIVSEEVTEHDNKLERKNMRKKKIVSIILFLLIVFVGCQKGNMQQSKNHENTNDIKIEKTEKVKKVKKQNFMME